MPGWFSADKNLFLPHERQGVAETSFLPAEMIILKMGAIEHGAPVKHISIDWDKVLNDTCTFSVVVDICHR